MCQTVSKFYSSLTRMTWLHYLIEGAIIAGILLLVFSFIRAINISISHDTTIIPLQYIFVGSQKLFPSFSIVLIIGTTCYCRIGTEHEKFGFESETLRPMKYAQISELLYGISERFDWDKIMEGDYIIGLKQVIVTPSL